VITLNESHALQLTDVDPVTGKVMWQHPYAASDVTPGEFLAPALAGDTVLDVTPAGKATSPAVNISGIDVTTGMTKWSGQTSVLLSDNPASCDGNQEFCLTGYNPDGTSAMVILNATTGREVTVLSGPNRALGTNLYQSGATTPTLEQLTSTGTIGWTKPASAIFGSGYDPGDGWNIVPVGSLNVGSFGVTLSDNTMNLTNNKTVGFSIATGATAWSIPGSYMCMGGLIFLTTQVTCEYSGVVKEPTKGALYPSMNGVTLKLAGFNPNSGAITWTQPVKDVEAMTFGNELRFEDAEQLVVLLPNGKQALLNTATGSTTSLTRSTVLWCQKQPIFKIPAAKGTEGGGRRASAPVYYPCTPTGTPTSKLPPSFPSTVGTVVNGVFVWPSPSGLQTHTVGVPQSSV
jgi:hypothetical protein